MKRRKTPNEEILNLPPKPIHYLLPLRKLGIS